MPLNLEGYEFPTTLLEHRTIRAGEKKESGVPTKKPIRIAQALINLETRKYDPDIELMKKAAERAGVDKEEFMAVRKIPVMLLSDKVEGEDGVIYLERAWYAGRRRRCGSSAHIDSAFCHVDIDEYVRSKKIVWLQKAREISCTDKCPMWVKPEDRGKKKEECYWRVIVTVQLMDSAVFPSPTHYRVSGVNTMKAMITSLNHISAITGGVLMGIPLWLKQGFKDVNDAQGKFRRIPVVTFEFEGTIQELRAHAYREVVSRQQLKEAREGKWPEGVPSPRFVDHQDMEFDEAEARVEDDADESEVKKQELIETSSEIALLAKKLGFTRARMKALEDKHQGDMDAILAELKMLAGGSQFNPSPGEPGAEEEQPDDQDEEQASDWDDGMFDM